MNKEALTQANNVDKLVRMANQIGTFFASMPDHEEGVDGVANHLKKFWEPRMRKALFAALDTGQVSDQLNEIVLKATTKHRQLLLDGCH
ncbi:MAG: formate dehydrogenase [Burkholderiaceae bacterium]|nr:MAG: formate dehydrogenase [Burkholderiaceae bacterium]